MPSKMVNTDDHKIPYTDNNCKGKIWINITEQGLLILNHDHGKDRLNCGQNETGNKMLNNNHSIGNQSYFVCRK